MPSTWEHLLSATATTMATTASTMAATATTAASATTAAATPNNPGEGKVFNVLQDIANLKV